MIELFSISRGTADIFLVICKNQEENNVILVDGGLKGDYEVLKEATREVIEKYTKIDLMIITHVDRDHITGIPTLIREDFINKSTLNLVLFNTNSNIPSTTKSDMGDLNISFRQGNEVLEELQKKGIKVENCFFNDKESIIHLGKNQLYILSPTQTLLEKLKDKWDEDNTDISSHNDKDLTADQLDKVVFCEDDAIVNGSSIAFLLKDSEGNSLLMAADAFPSTLVACAKKFWDKGIIVDLIKVPHHGSYRNTSESFLNFFKSQYYIMACGEKSYLPHKKVLKLIADKRKDSTIICANNNWIFQKEYKEELEAYGLRLVQNTSRKLRVESHDIKFD